MWNYQIEENILYEDKEILVCRKTAGMPVQAAKIGKCSEKLSGTKNTGKDPISGSSTSP